MSQPEFYRAIYVDCPAVLEMLAALNPDFDNVEYEEMHMKFVVLNYPEKGHLTTVDPEQDFYPAFDHFENGIGIKTYHFHTK